MLPECLITNEQKEQQTGNGEMGKGQEAGNQTGG